MIIDTIIPLIKQIFKIEKINVDHKKEECDKSKIEMRFGILRIVGRSIYKEYPYLPIALRTNNICYGYEFSSMLLNLTSH